VALLVSTPTGLIRGPRYDNCVYGEGTLCTFSTVLRPGVSYGLSRPINLRLPADSARGSQTYAGATWMTAAAAEDFAATFGWSGRASGADGPLELTELAGSAGLPQADVNPLNDTSTTTLTVAGARRPRVTAVGARFTGAPGDLVTARIGFLNHGPGTLLPNVYANNDFPTLVAMPHNVRVLKVDKRCQWAWSRHYICWPPPAAVRPGGRTLYAFDLAITSGSARGGGVELQLDGFGPTSRATFGTATGTRIAGLPITGTGASLILAALALIAAGVAGVLMACRRRRWGASSAGAEPPAERANATGMVSSGVGDSG
jgi:hypothetical protein